MSLQQAKGQTAGFEWRPLSALTEVSCTDALLKQGVQFQDYRFSAGEGAHITYLGKLHASSVLMNGFMMKFFFLILNATIALHTQRLMAIGARVSFLEIQKTATVRVLLSEEQNKSLLPSGLQGLGTFRNKHLTLGSFCNS